MKTKVDYDDIKIRLEFNGSRGHTAVQLLVLLR